MLLAGCNVARKPSKVSVVFVDAILKPTYSDFKQ